MAIKLTDTANEGSTFAVQVSFYDENGDAVAPDSGSITWTLTDEDATVVNSRSAVAATSATTITIVLSGNDLPVPGNSQRLFLTVECTYTSSLGSNLPLREQIEFDVLNLIA